VRGRVAHESVFNRNDGQFRCPSSQQGYSPFTTWTRGAAWIICGYAEQLEFLDTVKGADLDAVGGRRAVTEPLPRDRPRLLRLLHRRLLRARRRALLGLHGAQHPQARRLHQEERRSLQRHDEPVDSSAAAIAAQGLLRLGTYLNAKGEKAAGQRYFQAGLTIADTLFAEPYLSTDKKHQGLLLHSVYHRPNGWDHIAKGQKVPNGESSMWGDYHAMELALLIQRLAQAANTTRSSNAAPVPSRLRRGVACRRPRAPTKGAPTITTAIPCTTAPSAART
jgi:unsaturated chondroitin disaccharide hydrolase